MNPAHPRSDPADIAHHDEQDMIMTIDIALPTEFTQEHAVALGQYFQSETRLNRTQWELVWDGLPRRYQDIYLLLRCGPGQGPAP